MLWGVKSVDPERDPEVAALLREGREAAARPPTGRQLRAELVVGGTFVLAAVALLLAAPDGTDWSVGPLIALLLAYAVAANVRFELGQGETDATLLVLVPMLFLLPAEAVPLVVVAGYALGRLPDIRARREHPADLVFALAGSWHAIGPALVLVLATDPGGPRWEDGPWYVVALAALLLLDTASGLARETLGRGVRPELQLRLLLRVWGLDAALAPVGLLAAFACTRGTYGFLLLAPLAVVLGGLARERGTRLGHALALAEARTALLESELAAAKGREEALAAVSHGLQTPLASVIGLARLLDERGDSLTAERRMLATGQLHREALALRHRVRQILDYPRLRAGRQLALRPGRCDVREVVARALEASGAPPDTSVEAVTAEVLELDAVRVEQVVTALLENAVRHGASPLRVAATVAPGGPLRIEVADAGPGVPADRRSTIFDDPGARHGVDEASGTGIGLYVAAGIASALGGTLQASFPDSGGSRFVLELPPVAAGATTGRRPAAA